MMNTMNSNNQFFKKQRKLVKKNILLGILFFFKDNLIFVSSLNQNLFTVLKKLIFLTVKFKYILISKFFTSS